MLTAARPLLYIEFCYTCSRLPEHDRARIPSVRARFFYLTGLSLSLSLSLPLSLVRALFSPRCHWTVANGHYVAAIIAFVRFVASAFSWHRRRFPPRPVTPLPRFALGVISLLPPLLITLLSLACLLDFLQRHSSPSLARHGSVLLFPFTPNIKFPRSFLLHLLLNTDRAWICSKSAFCFTLFFAHRSLHAAWV